VGELEYKYALCDGQLPGAVDVGIGYTSAGEVDGIYMPQTWGWYLDFEQIICREACGTPDDEQGLGVFAQYGSGYPKATVEFQEYFGAGLVYRGLIAGRDDDTCGVGVARSRLSLGGTGVETATEVFYKARLRPGVYVQPDLQYIASPSGLYRDALVVGLRFEVAF